MRTLCRTALDEWSDQRKDRYLRTHNTYKRQTTMPPQGFEPIISASKRLRIHTARPLGSALNSVTDLYIRISPLIFCFLCVFLLPDQDVYEPPERTFVILIYMQSNKIHKVFLVSEFYSALMLARHISDLAGPSSGAFLTSCICKTLVCGNTRTTRHVQPLRSCRKCTFGMW